MIEDISSNLKLRDEKIIKLNLTITSKDAEIDDLTKNLKNLQAEKDKLRKLQVSKMEFEMQQTREIDELSTQIEMLKNEYSSNIERLQSDHSFQHERLFTENNTQVDRIKMD